MRPHCFARVLAVLLFLGILTVTPRSPVPQTLSDLIDAAKQSSRGDGLFGSTEIKSNSLRGLAQWSRVVGAVGRQSGEFDRCITDTGACTTSLLKQWRSIIVAATPLSPHEKIRAVNDFFNRWPYKQDRELYGVPEYWATPKEFMSRSGDCEDYAIAKYFALRSLGFTEDSLRVVVLRDRIRGIGHAVLAVYLEDEILILDSLSNLIFPHSRYKHYLPQVSMNESARWAHIGGFERPEPSIFRSPRYRRDN